MISHCITSYILLYNIEIFLSKLHILSLTAEAMSFNMLASGSLDCGWQGAKSCSRLKVRQAGTETHMRMRLCSETMQVALLVPLIMRTPVRWTSSPSMCTLLGEQDEHMQPTATS